MQTVCSLTDVARPYPKIGLLDLLEESQMRTLCACSLTTIGMVLAGTAIAQVLSVENPRVSRHCTGATLNTDPTAPCADDVLWVRAEPAAVRYPSELLPY